MALFGALKCCCQLYCNVCLRRRYRKSVYLRRRYRKSVCLRRRYRKSVCLVDSSGQNRVLPGLHRRAPRPTSAAADYETDPGLAWKVGFSETSGIRNKLVATCSVVADNVA